MAILYRHHLLTLITIFFIPLTVFAQGPSHKDYAVFFVVSEFDDSSWTTLSFAYSEVEAIADELHNTYGFEVNIVKDPTRLKIVNVLKEYKKKNYGPHDQLLIFFSTHGVHDQGNDQGYLIPKDGLIKDEGFESWYSHNTLRDMANSMSCSRILIALDACYSGIFGGTKSGNPKPEWEQAEYQCEERLEKAFKQDKTRKFLTAGGDTRVPTESIFAARWLVALKTGGGDDGLLGVETLYSDYLKYSASNVQPTFGDFDPKTSGDFVFAIKNVCKDTTMIENMILISGGTFQMGSKEGLEDERPVHTATINSFYLGKFEVSVREFRIFIKETGYKTDAEKGGCAWSYQGSEFKNIPGRNWQYDPTGNPALDDRPVIHVSWNDAMAYCSWLSKKTGKTYRLPTEAEWEFAAGNGSQHTRYSWGDQAPAKEEANLADQSGAKSFDWIKQKIHVFLELNDNYPSTAPVHAFDPNQLKVYNMTGNVAEWCLDWYSPTSYAESPSQHSFGPFTGTNRVFRGGSWSSIPDHCRVAYRNAADPSSRFSDVGFRVVRLP